MNEYQRKGHGCAVVRYSAELKSNSLLSKVERIDEDLRRMNGWFFRLEPMVEMLN